MAHPQQRKFIQLIQGHFVKNNLNKLNRKINILEIGSYDVNGSIREFLQTDSAQYIEVDLCDGKGVDVVSYGHKLSLPNDSFDIAVSCECFEHDEYWADTFKNMHRMTKPGGLIAFTCGTLGRLEHGIIRSNAEHSPGTQFIGLDYYKNLDKEDFYNTFNIESMFSEHYFFLKIELRPLFF